ncbi:MAG TPA: DUF1569 domain-containing protein [Flavisolibacter sp.]|nr:DUF1569 domain-containing protein [Flavisolibacter sp.]
MRKNLLDKDCCQSVINRAQNLDAESQPLWGTMSVTEMLHHCSKVHRQVLSPAGPATQKTSLKQYFFRWMGLYALPRFPKGVQTPKQFRTKGLVDKAAFEAEKKDFIATVQLFAAHQNPINHFHPYFGKLSTQQWGLTSWKHVDHHLRQFGV